MQVPRLLRLSFLLRLVAADAAPLVDVSAAAATAPAELMDAIAARDAAREALEIHSCVRAFVRSCVRAFVRSCVRAFVRSQLRDCAMGRAGLLCCIQKQLRNRCLPRARKRIVLRAIRCTQ